jgi:hypothetical protein
MTNEIRKYYCPGTKKKFRKPKIGGWVRKQKKVWVSYLKKGNG